MKQSVFKRVSAAYHYLRAQKIEVSDYLGGVQPSTVSKFAVVLPNLPTQPWYAKALSMGEKPPIHLQASKDLLILPSHPNKTHLLFKKLSMMICLLSGKV